MISIISSGVYSVTLISTSVGSRVGRYDIIYVIASRNMMSLSGIETEWLSNMGSFAVNLGSSLNVRPARRSIKGPIRLTSISLKYNTFLITNMYSLDVYSHLYATTASILVLSWIQVPS